MEGNDRGMGRPQCGHLHIFSLPSGRGVWIPLCELWLLVYRLNPPYLSLGVDNRSRYFWLKLIKMIHNLNIIIPTLCSRTSSPDSSVMILIKKYQCCLTTLIPTQTTHFIPTTVMSKCSTTRKVPQQVKIIVVFKFDYISASLTVDTIAGLVRKDHYLQDSLHWVGPNLLHLQLLHG